MADDNDTQTNDKDTGSGSGTSNDDKSKDDSASNSSDKDTSTTDKGGEKGTDDLEERIRKIVQEIVGKDGDSNSSPPRRASVEEHARRLVEEAANALAKQKEHDKQHEDFAAARKAAESAPKKTRKITKLLWGDDQ